MSRPLLALLFLSISLSGCPNQQPSAKKPTNGAASAPKVAAAKPHVPAKPNNLLVANDGRSELTLPPHWAALSGPQSLNDDAKLQLGSQQSSAAIAVFTDLKVDFDEMTLEKRSDQYLSQLSDSTKRIKRKVGPRQLTLNGMPALQYRTEFVSPDNVNMVAVLTSIEGEQGFYQVLYVSLLSEFDQEQPSLDAALNSFRQVTRPLPPTAVAATSARPAPPVPAERAPVIREPGSNGVQPIPVTK